MSSRSRWRDAFFYDSDNWSTILGGFFLGRGTTNATIFTMIQVCFVTSGEFELETEQGFLVGRDDLAARPGNYFILTKGMFYLNPS